MWPVLSSSVGLPWEWELPEVEKSLEGATHILLMTIEKPPPSVIISLWFLRIHCAYSGPLWGLCGHPVGLLGETTRYGGTARKYRNNGFLGIFQLDTTTLDACASNVLMLLKRKRVCKFVSLCSNIDQMITV